MIQHEYHCDECPHIFATINDEDDQWGHPCFDRHAGNKRNPGETHRCESYRQHMVVMTAEEYQHLVSRQEEETK